jgi:hypothetical protein
MGKGDPGLDWNGEWSSDAVFTTPTFVRTRRRWNSWVSWNNRLGGGPMLLVRAHAFRIVAQQGTRLESRDLTFESSTATMRFDRIGWAGTPIDRKNCIHLFVVDGRGRRVELALTPKVGLRAAWDALLGSGVQAAQ